MKKLIFQKDTTLLKRQLKMHLVKNRHLIPALVLSFLGFIDASYLTIVHYRDALPNCSILKGCDIVTTSALSTIGGIPIALFGALFYLALSFFAILIITHPHKTWAVSYTHLRAHETVLDL